MAMVPATRVYVPEHWGKVEHFELRRGVGEEDYWPYCLICDRGAIADRVTSERHQRYVRESEAVGTAPSGFSPAG
eukprot:5347147-Lingulodinium_polyedra.AAC.1